MKQYVSGIFGRTAGQSLSAPQLTGLALLFALIALPFVGGDTADWSRGVAAVFVFVRPFILVALILGLLGHIRLRPTETGLQIRPELVRSVNRLHRRRRAGAN